MNNASEWGGMGISGCVNAWVWVGVAGEGSCVNNSSEWGGMGISGCVNGWMWVGVPLMCGLSTIGESGNLRVCKFVMAGICENWQVCK